MRGKGWLLLTVTVQNGITPAYAGKSGGWKAAHSMWRDHPRVCGEKKLCLALHPPAAGSPPRMRGKGEYTCNISSVNRITPAYAGKSSYVEHLPDDE